MSISIQNDRRCTSTARMHLHAARESSCAHGFTLIELMITVAVIAILAALAVPTYSRYILRSNRSAAESFMQEAASAQERYMVDSRQFASSLTALGYATLPNTVQPNYAVAMVAVAASASGGTPPAYTITATPQGNQVRDTGCGTLTLNGDGSKSASTGAADCWR